MPTIRMTDDDCDWVHSHFTHRIVLLQEYLADEPDNEDLREEMRAAESVVSALRRSGYRDYGERRRDAAARQGYCDRDREDFHSDEAVGFVGYREDGPFDD